MPSVHGGVGDEPAAVVGGEPRAAFLWNVAGFALLFLASLTSCDNGRRMKEIEARQAAIREMQGEIQTMMDRFRERQITIGNTIAEINERQRILKPIIEAIAKQLKVETIP